MKRVIFMVILLLGSAFQALAVRAYPYPVNFMQPDGSVITLRIHGDESFSWKTTLDGRPVFQDRDGYYKVTDSLPASTHITKSLVPEGGQLALFLATKTRLDIRTIVIPVQFADRKFTVPSPKVAINKLFNQNGYNDNGATGSVSDYFNDNLSGNCHLAFEVCDVVTLPYEARYYGANEQGSTDFNIRQLVVSACNAAHKAGVDFSKFDFNGDGYVDNVFIIFAGHNEAEGGGDDCIWPQSWNIAGQQLILDGMRISNFSLYSEYSGANGYEFAGIGTICHEYCHFLGLPDLYDVNGDTEGLSEGLGGKLSIMDYGNYNNQGRTPPYLSSFERQLIGVLPVKKVKEETHLSLPPVQEAVYAYQLPSSVYGEDFQIEYRNGAKWDSHIGGQGIIIYHIDKSGNSAGSVSADKRWSINAVNAYAPHPCAHLVFADGESSGDISDAFFPGHKAMYDIHSAITFPLLGWNGKGIGLGVCNMEISGTGMDCDIVYDNSWDLPVITNLTITPGQTSAELQWESDKSSKDGQWIVEWSAYNSIKKEVLAVIGDTNCTLEGLIPGTSYTCKVYFSKWNVSGKPVTMQFEAIKKLNSFPLIGGADARYMAGDVFRLIVLNLEDEAKVDWYIDGKACREESFTFTESGKYLISAILRYNDGTEETLTKILDVK